MESIITALKDELRECRSTIETQANVIDNLQSLTRSLAGSIDSLTRKMSFSKMSVDYKTRRVMRDNHNALIDSAVEANEYNVKYVKTLQNELSSDKTDLAS